MVPIAMVVKGRGGMIKCFIHIWDCCSKNDPSLN